MEIEKTVPAAQTFVPRPFPPEKHRILDELLESERQARQNSNMELSQSTVRKILDLLLPNEDPVRLIQVVKVLCQKRGQIIRTVTELVRACMAYVDKISDEPLKIYFVTELKNICDKKIYVEVEYARCAMILVKYNETKGANLEEAARIMENVQVETYSSMTKQEKVEFILYQMHIQFILGDPIRLIIVSKKINPKMLNEPGFSLYKVTYYLYLYFLNLKSKDFAACSENLEQVLDGLQLTADLQSLHKIDSNLQERYVYYFDKQTVAEAVLLFAALAPHHDGKIAKLAQLKKRYECHLPVQSRVIPTIDSFLSKEVTSGMLDLQSLTAFPPLSRNASESEELLTALGGQLIKKNIVIIATYFRNIRMRRLSEILEAPIDQVEDGLCDLIVDGIVKGKIDRPNGVIHFVLAEISNDDEMVDGWVKNINEIVDIIDLACERIEHEDVLVK